MMDNVHLNFGGAKTTVYSYALWVITVPALIVFAQITAGHVKAPYQYTVVRQEPETTILFCEPP